MQAVVEIGKVSSRGQVAIPVEIRQEMGLQEGSKLLFLLEEDTLLIKKVSSSDWAGITKPLREAGKKIKEEGVNELIHSMRRK